MPEVAPPVASAAPSVRIRRGRLLRRLLANRAGAVGLLLTSTVAAIAVFVDVMAPADPFRTVAPPLEPPSVSHPMGTDDLGRDVLSGVLHGARTSMAVTASVVAIASIIGVALGAVAGYVGHLLDDALMRLTELVQAIPRFFLAILVVAFFGVGLEKVVLVLGLTSWPMLARLVRAEVLSVREREFVAAARSVGSSRARILFRHILPNVFPTVLVMMSLLASSVILIEAGLGFLGLGDPEAMSWGYLANNAQSFLRVAWWMAVFPGAAIAVTVIGLNLLGDALNDALDPLRRSAAEAVG